MILPNYFQILPFIFSHSSNTHSPLVNENVYLYTRIFVEVIKLPIHLMQEVCHKIFIDCPFVTQQSSLKDIVLRDKDKLFQATFQLK